ncbi:MAG: hypothetical protein WAL85_15190 [Candidatus Korobacteraceae bacterium]
MISKRNFDAARYLNISQDHLVAVSLWFLLEEKMEPSFENLVAEAYLSFPERFQLEGYPDWPNAHVVGKSWVRCRTDKKWITGSAASGFSLTPLGEKAVQQTLSKLPARFDRNEGIMYINTLGPGVDLYFGKDGEGQDLPANQVLVADLVTDLASQEIGRGKREKKSLDIPPGVDPFEAYSSYVTSLKAKVAPATHKLLVDRANRRK